MRRLKAFISDLLAGFPQMPPIRARQRTVYWGVILISTLVIASTSWYIQRIPAALEAEAKARLDHHPWLQPMVAVDGRDIALRGTVEPGAGLEADLQRLADIPGVRTVRDQLETEPRPAPEFRLEYEDGRVTLDGRLAGDDLGPVTAKAAGAWPDAEVSDRIRIDDRLGRPLWTEDLDALLGALTPLDRFTLYGWRDRLLVDGVAPSAMVLDQVRYHAPVSLDPSIRLSFRLRPATADDSASLSLVAGWNGTALSGSLHDAGTARALAAALEDWAARDEPPAVRLNRANGDADPEWLPSVPGLLGALGRVHDLRLATGGDGLWLWGRVDDAETLGEVYSAIDAAGLGDVLHSRVVVDPADEQPEISFFRDAGGSVVSGRLPSPHSRARLLEALATDGQAERVEDLTTIEPGIAFSPWLERWPTLLPAMPDAPFGLTIAGDRALVSGIMPTETARIGLGRALDAMLPGIELVDWLTVAADD